MNDTQYSLNDLRDIVSPTPPAWWPPAHGVWLLLVLLALLLLVLLYQWRQRRKENAYRVAGLEMLENAASVRDISLTLKRVALVAFPREQVASLYGVEWQLFLEQQCQGCNFGFLAVSCEHPAQKNQIEEARRWIKQHSAKGRNMAPGEN